MSKVKFILIVSIIHLISSICLAQVTTRISLGMNGAEANNFSTTWQSSRTITADGRFVAFSSKASNLVPNDTNGDQDIFVYDRRTAIMERVNVDSNGNQVDVISFSIGSRNPVISADGRYVAFESWASSLVPNDTNGVVDIFMHDRVTNATVMISVDSFGNGGISSSDAPAMSADGRFVVFASSSVNLVANDNNGKIDIFVHDRETGITERVSEDSFGMEGDTDSHRPSISGDGRYVTFESDTPKFAPAAGSTFNSKIYLHDRETGITSLVSKTPENKMPSGESWLAGVSANGKFIQYESEAEDIVANDGNGHFDVFLYDVCNDTTIMVSRDANGNPGNSYSDTVGSMSEDGRFIGFQTNASNLFADDSNGQIDSVIFDRETGAFTNVSVDSFGVQGNAKSLFPVISLDGRFKMFGSLASNLSPNDTNGYEDVFVHGPELTMELDPAEVKTGRSFTITAWGGAPGQLVQLYLTSINGVSLLLPITNGVFDVLGEFSITLVIPNSAMLLGNSLKFQAAGVGPVAGIGLTNEKILKIAEPYGKDSPAKSKY